jgi:hypothetical protein
MKVHLYNSLISLANDMETLFDLKEMNGWRSLFENRVFVFDLCELTRGYLMKDFPYKQTEPV